MDWRSHNIESFAQMLQRKSQPKRARQTSPAEELASNARTTSPTRADLVIESSHGAADKSTHEATHEASQAGQRHKKKAKRGPAGTGDSLHHQGCCLCGRRPRDPYHQCQDCSLVLCSFCIINAPCAHPFPDHTLRQINPADRRHVPAMKSKMDRVRRDPEDQDRQETTPDRDTAKRRQRKRKTSGRSDDWAVRAMPLTPEDTDNNEAPKESVESKSTDLYRCSFCDQRIKEFRYACQDCPDAVFCLECSGLHFKGHALRKIALQTPHAESNGKTIECSGGFSNRSNLGDEGSGDGGSGDGDSGDGGSGYDNSSSGGEEGHEVVVARRAGHSFVDPDPDTSYEDKQASRKSGSRRSTSRLEQLPIEDLLAATGKVMSEVISKEIGKVVDKAIKAAMAEATRLVHEGSRSDSGSDDDEPRRKRRKSGSEPARLRRWGPDDCEELAKLKRKGWSDTRIAEKLGRTIGAIAQQWRKQQ